jgi:hypothetical protein
LGAPERIVDRSDGEPDEQRRCRSEADTANADSTNSGAEGNGEERKKDRVLGENVNDG